MTDADAKYMFTRRVNGRALPIETVPVDLFSGTVVQLRPKDLLRGLLDLGITVAVGVRPDPATMRRIEQPAPPYLVESRLTRHVMRQRLDLAEYCHDLLARDRSGDAGVSTEDLAGAKAAYEVLTGLLDVVNGRPASTGTAQAFNAARLERIADEDQAEPEPGTRTFRFTNGSPAVYRAYPDGRVTRQWMASGEEEASGNLGFLEGLVQAGEMVVTREPTPFTAPRYDELVDIVTEHLIAEQHERQCHCVGWPHECVNDLSRDRLYPSGVESTIDVLIAQGFLTVQAEPEPDGA